jgi:preprotein translocase subunit SecD
MIHLSRWKVILLACRSCSACCSFPNVLSPEQRAQAAGLVPKSALNLGLDLQGGSYLLLEVDVPAMRGQAPDQPGRRRPHGAGRGQVGEQHPA